MPTKTKAHSNGKSETGPGSDEPFSWEAPNGTTITVSSLAKPFRTAGELRAHRSDSPIELAYYIIERDCDKTMLTALDELTMDEFNETFSRAWAAHSGIDLGE